MAQIPKIGLNRLQQGADLQAHPDAELITGFIENAITTRERTELLNHLGRCHQCREIVSLSMPERMEIVAPREANRWFSWPVWRWAGAVACVVAVGTAVILHYAPRSRSADVATAQPIQVATLDRKVVEPASPIPATALATKRSERDDVTAQTFVVQKKKTGRESKNSIFSNGTIAVAGDQAEANSSEVALEARNGPAAIAPTTDGMVPGRAKEAEPAIAMDNSAVTAKQQAMALPGANAMVASRARLLPRWALTSDGILQRSLDAGITWETVSVAPQSRLRALAANGFDIWVGGSSGALYHSSDGGQHWSQIQPVVNGEVLSADIIGVEFPDSQHGKIRTSSLESWTTDDAGEHWQKQ
jgi:Photosynthesis system II assembly factor YCF48